MSVKSYVCKVLMTTINKLYYDPARPSTFSTLQKLRSATAAAKKKGKLMAGAYKRSVDVIRGRLEKQDAYTRFIDR